VDPVSVTVAIALGANLGDRRAHLEAAVEQLAAHLADLRVSSLIETEPVDVPTAQPPYLNGAVVGVTSLGAHALLDLLMAIEIRLGRTRPSHHAPRTVDLDLILYGDRQIDAPGLTVPHPAFRDRLFVLTPLAEVAPDLVDPVTGLTIRALEFRARTEP
jgi:2-amino-4-hydroxy-6-hydroxymethyldihydropteridine diphosphokinase